jgi:hypothetical protein
MSRERERMLAEGPRVAPEPRTVDAFDPGSGKFVIRESATADDAVRAGTTGGAQRLSLRRLLVPLFFVGFFAAQLAGLGGFAWLLLLAAILVGSLFAERGGAKEEV